jgi:hypothetical protein
MAASMQEYVVRVRRTPEGEYRATVREVAPGVPLDVRTVPTGALGGPDPCLATTTAQASR